MDQKCVQVEGLYGKAWVEEHYAIGVAYVVDDVVQREDDVVAVDDDEGEGGEEVANEEEV